MDIEKIKKKFVKNFKDDISGFSGDLDKFSLKQLPSKKNLVYEVTFIRKPRNLPKEFILKKFQTKNMENEIKTYKKLENQDIDVPKLFLYKKSYLLLEKLNGANLCDVINDNLLNKVRLDDLDLKVKERIIENTEKLAIWIAKLHKNNVINEKDPLNIIVLNKGDARLKDFIINSTTDKLYGFDFEDSYEGNHIDDLTWICTALLDTNPGIFEMPDPKHKIELINIFLTKYYSFTSFNFNFNYFAEVLIDNLNIVMKRRSIRLSPLKKATFIEEIKKEL
ncbi:MAG: hypothetical protein ACFE9T_13370 [Promethearchaeota archaeon]